MNIIPTNLTTLEVLDSRGRPPVLLRLQTQTGAKLHAAMPCGASSGSSEVVERRACGTERFPGKGILTTVSHVTDEIAEALVVGALQDRAALDDHLIELDGTSKKCRLGVNRIVEVRDHLLADLATGSGWEQQRSGAPRFGFGREGR